MPSIETIEKEVELLKNVIEQLIVWIASSAVSPITREEANNLLNLLHSNQKT